MRSTIMTRRQSSTPSQLEDLHEFANLLTSDDCLSNNSINEWTDKFSNSNFNWKSLEEGIENSSIDLHSDPDSPRPSPGGPWSTSSSRASPDSMRKCSNCVSSLTNPNIDDVIEAISVMTVHEISSSISSSIYSASGRLSNTSDVPPKSCQTLLSRHTFESLWNVLEDTGLRDFEQSILYLHRIPEPAEISEFLNYMYNIVRFTPECLVIAFLYVSRVLNNPYNVTLSSITWRPLFFSCALLAHKYWDDDYLANQDFVQGYPNHTGFEANRLERTVFKLLEYRVGVLPSAYARSYFGLRAAAKLTQEKNYRQRQYEKTQGDRSQSSDSRSTYDTSRRSTGSDCCLASIIHSAEHTELRRGLQHIIHGADCTCQQPFTKKDFINETRLNKEREIQKANVATDDKKKLWMSVRHAGDLLRKLIMPISGLRRTSTEITRHKPMKENRCHSYSAGQPDTFNRSIITMAIHPFTHHPVYNFYNKQQSELPCSQMINLDCEMFTLKCEDSEEEEEENEEEPQLEPLQTCRRSAPDSLLRRSLSFESMPTLKKGLQLNDEYSQPPIIGHHTPEAQSPIKSYPSRNRYDPYFTYRYNERDEYYQSVTIDTEYHHNRHHFFESPTPQSNCYVSFGSEHPSHELVCWDHDLTGKRDIE